MGKIELKGVEKTFGNVHVIQGVDLVVEDGASSSSSDRPAAEVDAARLIAGLEDATGGAILIDGVDVIDQPPAKRGLSMVFQSALYPT
jgi:multiple sugar transport system ATP-binding protein